MAFDAAKARELMDGERTRREEKAAAQQQVEQGTTWMQDRMEELNTEIADSTPEETYAFDPEESREQFNAVGDLISNTATNINEALSQPGIFTDESGEYYDGEESWENRRNLALSPLKEPARQFIAAYADDKSSSFQDMAQGLRQSSANIEYFMTPEEKLETARKINQRLPMIPGGAMLASTEAMQGAMFAYDMAEKMDAVGGDMEKVYREIPALRTISAEDPIGAAIALKNIKHVYQAKNVIDSFRYGWEHGNANYEYGILKMKEAYEGLTDDERDEAEKLERTLRQTEQYYPSFFVDPLLAMAGGVESLPEMIYTTAKSIPYGVAGAAVGAAIAGAPTFGSGAPAGASAGFTWGRRAGMAYEMFKPMMGRKFAEYQSMTDENGAPLMTRTQARNLATLEAVPEAAIEMGAFELGVWKNLTGSGYAKQAVQNIVENGKSAIAVKSFSDLLTGIGKDLTVGSLREMLSESGEEFLQTYPDAIVNAYIENAKNVSASDLDVPKSGMSEITGDQRNKNFDLSLSRLSETMGNLDWADVTKKAVAQGAAAAPGSLMLGVLSSGVGVPVSGARFGIERSAWMRQWSDMAKVERTTLSGAIMLDQLQATVQDSKLKDAAPDVQREIIREELKDTPWQMAWINVNSALEQENGEDDVREVGRAAGKSDAEIEAAIATRGVLTVPVECYAQSKASPKLLDSVSFSEDAEPLAVIKKNAAEVSDAYNRRMEREVKKQIDLTEAMTNELFPDSGEERDAALSAIYQNPENPAQGWKELYDAANAEMDEIIAPAVAALDRGMGQGASVVETVNEIGEVSTGRVSNNEEWYQEWYKKNKRPPTQQEKRDLAKLMVMGDVNAPQVYGWRPTSGEEAAAMESMRERVTALDNEINLLNSIKDRMQTLSGTEMQLTSGMTPEAYKVYRTITSNLLQFGGKVGRAARVSALMWARHADVYAKRKQRRGHENYTAMDWLNDTIKGIEEGRNAHGEAYNQITNLDLDLDARVLPVNLTGVASLKTKNSTIKSYITGLVEKDFNMPVANGKAIISVLEKDIKHLTYSSKRSLDRKQNRAKNASILSLSDLLKNAVLVETEPNKKPDKKPHVLYYHRFYVPVRVGNNVYTVRLVAEEQKDVFTFNPTAINLYDVIIEDKESSATQPSQKDGVLIADDSTISIRELLTNVNDYYGNPYIDQSGNGNYVDAFNQFAGQNAKTADTVKLEEAQRMEADGASAEDIYKATGWIKGQDDKWRFIVPDNLNKIDFSSFTDGGYTSRMLPEIYDNPALYAAYPWLEHTLVEVADLGDNTNGNVRWIAPVEFGAKGFFYIQLNLKKINQPKIKETLVHEIQHSIQKYEKFAAGGSPEAARMMIERELDRLYAEEEKLSEDAREYVASRTRYDNILLGITEADEERTASIKKEFDKYKEIVPEEEQKTASKIAGRIRSLRRVLLNYGNEAMYWDLGGEQEARTAAGMAFATQFDEDTKREAEIITEKYNQMMDEAAPEVKEAVNQYFDAVRNAIENESEDKAENEALWEKVDEVSAKIPQDLLSVAEDYRSNQELLKSINARNEKLFTPHNINAIIVFDGREIPYSEAEQTQPILEILNQSAWHGSPHTFQKFDLGAIGTGEGAQAHGWGLYFAQDREVSERYKERLASRGGMRYRVTINGETVDQETKDVLDRISLNYLYREGKEHGQEAVKKEIQDAIERRRGRSQYGTEQLARKLVKALDAEIKHIDENPKMSITAFLKSIEGSEEKSRFKTIVERARRTAKEESRRATIQDVKNSINKHAEAFRYQVAEDEREAAILESLDLDNLNIEEDTGSLFEVEIPDEDVMLDEQKKLSEQPRKVKEALKKITKKISGRTEEQYEKYLAKHPETTGEDFYKQLTGFFWGQKAENPKRAASELLNEYGIKGISYEGYRDGRCYVVFDDQAIAIIDRYNQEMNEQGIQGQTIYNPNNGKRLVYLFENADESTFLHESGHIFLMDLEKLASEGDEESIEDLKTVNDWAEWHDGDAAKYKNTPWAQEFEDREKEIREAQKNGVAKMPDGTTKTLDQLLREWKQERFARAFEIYLYEGKSPSKGLRKVFDQFVNFLKQIYNVITSDGARASEQVEAVMARLMATDEEIESASLDERYENFTAAGGEKLLDETAKETFDRWHAEAKEEARDRLRRIVMRDLKKRAMEQREKLLSEERANKEEEFANQPVYLARQAIRESGIKDAWKAYFPTKAEWEQADAAAPTMEEALDAYIKEVAAVYDAEQIDDAFSEETVEAAMSEAPYHERLVDLERQAFAKKASLVNILSGKAKTSMANVEKMINDLPDDGSIEDNAEFQNAVTELKVSTRWSKEELEDIDKLAASASKSEAKKNFETLRRETQGRKVGLSDLREANRGRIESLRKQAKETIARQTLAQATQVQTHRQDEREAAREAQKQAKKNNWTEAARAKERELFASMMASEAKKTRDRMDALLKKIRRQINAKTKLPKDERYWHQHLAYLLRITDKDAEQPAGLASIQSLAISMGQGLDVVTDEDGQSDLLALMMKLSDPNVNRDGYHGMTLAEFEDAADALTALYVTGRDKFKMKTIKGKTVQEVVEEILEDGTSYNGATVQRSTITGNPNRGGIFWNEMLARIPGAGDTLAQYAQMYGLSLTKPEELINLLGQKAHQYLYDTYDRAAEQEAAMTADFVSNMQTILSNRYTPKELRDFQARVYEFQGQRLSKENMLAMAMNFGNDINMDRLVMGLGVNASVVERFLTENMTERDWLFCQDVWDMLSTYWPETVRVEMELNGTRLQPQTARAFKVQSKDAKGNAVIVDLRGGYYPIKYDPQLSVKAGEQAENALAQTGMSGAMVLGMGRGFTKDRAAKGAVKDRPLLLSLSVIPEHCGEAIHNITTRIAARDVYRLINDGNFRQYVESTLGIEAYKVLRTWATDVWKVKPEQSNSAESAANRAIRSLRQNSGIAIMGYRMWPVIENVTNIFPMMDSLGAAEAMSAIGDYYSNKKEFDQLIAKSMFMKERTERMERDMKGQRAMFERRNAVSEYLVEHAYDPITFTDLLTSKPLWARAYKNAFPTEMEKLRKENEENAATFEARRAEFDALNAEVIDLRNRRTAIQEEIRRRNLQQPVLAETEFTKMSRSALNDEIRDIDRRIQEKGREVFVAGEKMARAGELIIRTEKEILDEAEHRSILAADKAVREVIGSGDIKDQSEVQRSRNELIKALSMFYSYFNTQANAIIQAHWKGKWQGGDGYNFLPLAKAVAYRFMLTAALSTAMRWVFFSEGDDDKDKYKKDKDGNKIEVPLMNRVLKQYAKNMLSTSIGGLYGIREVGNFAINWLIDGQTYGGGARFDGLYGSFAQQISKEAQLIANKYERDQKAREEEEKRQAKYEKMTPAQKKRFREEQKYRRPPNTISYADILRGAGEIGTRLTAGRYGITDPLADAVLGTMQYIFDSDGRYDATLRNMMWSAFWTKKPVKRTPPEKPEKPKRKGR